MDNVINFTTRPPADSNDDGAGELIEELEGLLARAKAGQIKSLGVAFTLTSGTFATAVNHVGDHKALELGTAIMALQHDFIASFDMTSVTPIPKPQHEVEDDWVRGREHSHDTAYPLADPEE